MSHEAPPPPDITPAKPEPRGMGGWLLALLVLQVFYLVVDGIGLALAAWFAVVGKPGVPIDPLRANLAGQIVLHGTCFAVAVFATVLLARGHALFVRVFKLQLILFALVPVGELSLYWTIMHVFRGRAAIGEPTVGKVLVCFAIAVALGLYVSHSERVRNTFMRKPSINPAAGVAHPREL